MVAFAWRPPDQVAQGRVLQVAAFERADLLPLYGSSEVRGAQFAGNDVLREVRAGFLLLPVGRGGTTSLAMAQYLAGVGGAARGRPVAISISPQWFVWRLAVDPDQYAGSFSRLHAHEVVFSTRLGWALRRDLARRMRDHPRTLRRDPVLRLGVACLADGRLPGRLALAALWPLGTLERVVLRLQDQWEALRLVRRRQAEAAPVEPAAGPVDWDRMLARAAAAERARRATEPAARAAAEPGAPVFLDRVARSAEWEDLDLLLRVLADLDARPLLLAMPLNGTYYDAVGIPRAVREAYYSRLRRAVAARGFSMVDLSGHDGDPLFLRDFGGHPTVEGWVHYARALEAFHRAGAQPGRR